MKVSSDYLEGGVKSLSICTVSEEIESQKDEEAKVTKDLEEKNSLRRIDKNTNLENAVPPRDYHCDIPPKMTTQTICSLAVAMAHMGHGASAGFSGVTLPQLTQPDSGDIYLTPDDAALFGSIVCLGTAVGGLFCGPFVARFGHCKTLKITLPLTLALWLLLAFSTSVSLLIACRAGLGFMSGVIYSTTTGYTLEITHKEHRGTLFSFTPVFRQGALFFTYILGTTQLTWREMAMVCGAVTTVPSFFGLLFFPESPRWLLTRSRENDAMKSMIFFRGEKYDSKTEIKSVIKEVYESSSKISIRAHICQLLQKPVRKVFLMVGLIAFLTNFNGFNTIVTYVVPIFQAVEMDVNPYTSAILVGGMRVVGTVVLVILIDRLGRRLLHLATYCVMSATIALIGGYFYVQEIEWVVSNLSWVPLISLLVYTFFMGLGQPVLMMMFGELLPTHVRAVGVSILIFATFLGTFFVTQIYYLMADAMGVHGTFWTYGVMSMLVSVISFFCLPETQGLSLEEINDRKTDIDSKHKSVPHRSGSQIKNVLSTKRIECCCV